MSDPSLDTTGNGYKNEGNNYLEAGKVQKAIDSYTKAIECDANNHIFFSNRSAAYLKAFEFEKANDDATECIRLCPSFAKAYSRKAAALLSLKRFEECYEICLLGLKVETSSRPLSESIKACKKAYISSLLSGQWIGAMPVELGGYDQLMEFVDEETLLVQAMGQSVPCEYSLNVDKTPMWMDVKMPPPAEIVAMHGPNVPPQDIPHIFRFDADFWTPFVQRVTRRVDEQTLSKTQKKKLNKSGSNLNKSETEVEGEDAAVVEEDAAPVPVSLDLCAPFSAPVRPSSFSGAGMCTFRRVDPVADKERMAFLTNERNVSPEIAALSEDEQVAHFIDTMIATIPNEAMQQPLQTDSPQVQQEKMNAIMKFQTDLTKIDAQYPLEISTKVQEFTYSPSEEVPEKFREKMTILRTKLEHHQGAQAGSADQQEDMQRKIMAAMQEAKAAVDAAKAQGIELKEAEIQQLVQQKMLEVSSPGEPEVRVKSSIKNKETKTSVAAAPVAPAAAPIANDETEKSDLPVIVGAVAAAVAVIGIFAFLARRK